MLFSQSHRLAPWCPASTTMTAELLKLNTKSRESCRTRFPLQGALPSGFCSCARRYRRGCSHLHGRRSSSPGLEAELVAAVVLSRSLPRLTNDVIQTRQIRAARRKIAKLVLHLARGQGEAGSRAVEPNSSYVLIPSAFLGRVTCAWLSDPCSTLALLTP